MNDMDITGPRPDDKPGQEPSESERILQGLIDKESDPSKKLKYQNILVKNQMNVLIVQ